MLCQQKLFSDPTESLAVLHARRAIRNLTYKKKRVDIDALKDEWAATLELTYNKAEKYVVYILYARAVNKIVKYESLKNYYGTLDGRLTYGYRAGSLLKAIVAYSSNLIYA